jgi:hypothetical protein
MSERPLLPKSIFESSWQKARPDLAALLADSLRYLYLWIGMLFAHFVRFAMALSGIDPDTVRYVALMERWTWIASFACFFARVLIRAARAVRRD